MVSVTNVVQRGLTFHFRRRVPADLRQRLDRDLTGRFGGRAYAAEELVAELSAAFVLADLGLVRTPHPDHAAYCAIWAPLLCADPRALRHAAAQGSRAADYLAGLQPEAREALGTEDEGSAPGNTPTGGRPSPNLHGHGHRGHRAGAGGMSAAPHSSAASSMRSTPPPPAKTWPAAVRRRSRAATCMARPARCVRGRAHRARPDRRCGGDRAFQASVICGRPVQVGRLGAARLESMNSGSLGTGVETSGA